MLRSVLCAALMVALTGCTATKNKRIETSLREGAQLYTYEDVDALMASVPQDFSRTLPDGTLIEGADAYRTYLEDLFAVNEEILIDVMNVVANRDVIVMEYTWYSRVVAPSAYGVDLSGTSIKNHGVGLLYLNDDREVVRIVDIYDRATLASQSGYQLMLPTPPLMTSGAVSSARYTNDRR